MSQLTRRCQPNQSIATVSVLQKSPCTRFSPFSVFSVLKLESFPGAALFALPSKGCGFRRPASSNQSSSPSRPVQRQNRLWPSSRGAQRRRISFLPSTNRRPPLRFPEPPSQVDPREAPHKSSLRHAPAPEGRHRLARSVRGVSSSPNRPVQAQNRLWPSSRGAQRRRISFLPRPQQRRLPLQSNALAKVLDFHHRKPRTNSCRSQPSSQNKNAPRGLPSIPDET